jgi:hypothetical protein
VAKVTGNASTLSRSAAYGTELQPNTDPHIRSYSVNRSRKAEGDMISMPLCILISFRSRSPEMMMVAPASSASVNGWGTHIDV